jgi:O-antigen/teichoic acid export membrane protein
VSAGPDDAQVSRDELREATLGGLPWVTLARGAAEVCAFGSMVVLAHLVPPAEFGALAVALMVSEFANGLAGEGIGTPLVQRKSVGRAHLQAAALVSVACGLALTLATLALAPLVCAPLFGDHVAELFQLFSPAFLIAAVTVVPRAVLQRRLAFRRLSQIEIAALAAAVTASVTLAFAGLDAEALVLGNLTGGCVALVLLLATTRVPLPRWRPAAMRELLAFGTPATVSGLAWTATRNVDYAILGARVSAAQVGFYWRAFTLAVEYQRKLSGIVIQMALPVFSRAQGIEHMRAIRERIVRVNATLLFPFLATFVAVAPQLVPWLLGERWEPAVLPAQILAVAGMAAVVNTGTGQMVLAAGAPKAIMRFNLVQLALYAGLVYALAPAGLTAVCAGVAAFRVVMLIASYRLLMERVVGVTVGQLARDVAPAATGAVAMVAVELPLVAGLSAAGVAVPVTLCAAAAAGALAYLAVIRGLFAAAWSDLELIASRLLPGRKRSSESPVVPLASSSPT